MTHEIYPMPLFPLLQVSDLDASARFYQQALGFDNIFSMPGLAHLRWVKYADLLLAGPRDGQAVSLPRGAGVALNFNLFDRFNGDLHALAAQARAYGAAVTGPVDQPWNVRELTILDPDGYRLIFVTPIDLTAKFEDVIERTKSSM
jgi:catechol 2,3-dioxygenase-like lactoylglutathione lyase family enzyme